MNTRIPSSAPVQATQTTARVTPTQPKVPFAEVMGRTASLGAQAALGVVPGGQAIAAAVRGTGAQAGLGASPPVAQTMSAPLSVGGLPQASLAGGQQLSGAAVPSALAGAASSGALRSGLQAPGGAAGSAEGPGGAAGSGTGVNFDSALAQSADMNMYYLSIQERVNAENRSFTTLSNVMKAEHETVKTAIGNIR